MYPLVERSSFRIIKTARGLIRRQEFAQAEHLLAAALSRHPDHPRLLHQQALCATNSGAGSVAVARWTRLVEVAPTWDVAWAGLVAIRKVAGDMQLAEAIVAKASIRFPSSAAVLVEAAGVLDQKGNLDEAAAIWARLASRRRPDPHWEASYARCLIRSGSLVTAAGVIRRGLRRTPGNIHLLLARTALAMARADWDGALADLAKSCVLVPTDEGAAELTKRVATLRQVDGASANGRVEPSAADAIADPADLRQLMLAFESMGIDCEFGTVQRHYGAEPIGLLRWTDVACAKLIAALDASFDGIGDIDNIELVTDQKDIYYVEDRRFGLTMHTHLFANEIDAGTLLPKMSARIIYQRGKFLADLAEGRKTFVFKSEDPLDEIQALHAAMRRYGPLRLLHVRTRGLRGGPPEAAPGASISIAPDLHVGYVSIAGHLPQTPYAEWERICAAVARAPAL